MKLSTEAQAWLSATVQRVMERHHLAEPERSGVYYELMSHLHAAGERKARESGRDEVSVGDLQAAMLEMGGEASLEQAFVAPRAKPLPRAGLLKRTAAWIVDAIVLLVAWWVLAGIVFVSLTVIAWPFGAAGRVPRPPDPWGFWFDWPMAGVLGTTMLAFTVFLTLGYFTYLEGTRGQSFGKKVFNLRAVRVDGKPMTYREAAIRNLVKVFPPLLILDAVFMLIFFDKEKQRVSDRMAETTVVEVGA